MVVSASRAGRPSAGITCAAERNISRNQPPSGWGCSCRVSMSSLRAHGAHSAALSARESSFSCTPPKPPLLMQTM